MTRNCTFEGLMALTQDASCTLSVPFTVVAAVLGVVGYLLIMIAVETAILIACCCLRRRRSAENTHSSIRKTDEKRNEIEEIQVKERVLEKDSVPIAKPAVIQNELMKESSCPDNPAHIYAVLEEPVGTRSCSKQQDNGYAQAKDSLEGIPLQIVPKAMNQTCTVTHKYANIEVTNHPTAARSNSALPQLQSYRPQDAQHNYAQIDAARHNTMQLGQHSPPHPPPLPPTVASSSSSSLSKTHDTANFNFKSRQPLQSSLTRYSRKSNQIRHNIGNTPNLATSPKSRYDRPHSFNELLAPSTVMQHDLAANSEPDYDHLGNQPVMQQSQNTHTQVVF